MSGAKSPPGEEVRLQVRPDCPYQGLRPYTESDGDYFFGRDADRDLVVANLMASRLTVLYGPSGVGKSSLLQAGVMRQLRRMAEGVFSYLAVDRAIVVYQSSWRDDPLAGLGAALRDAVPDETVRAEVFGAGRRLSLDLLREVTRRLDTDVYLLCDQFEELPQYQTGAMAEDFAAELGALIATPNLRVSVLLGVREDALARLDSLQSDVPALFDNVLRLDHLDAAGAREAIEQPLAVYNASTTPGEQVTIEPDLVEELLRELRTGCVSMGDAGRGGVDETAATIETPFLQLVMTRLWAEEAGQGSHVLRRATLVELGGPERIVRTHLDAVMAEFTEEQRQAAASVFRHLVTPSGTKIAHTAADLSDYAGIADQAWLGEVLERLASGRERVLRPVPPPVDAPGPPRYEIFHDVMAPAVLDWRHRYEGERERVAAKRALDDARHRAQEENRKTHRRLRRSRLVSAALALLLVVALASGRYAWDQRGQARHNAHLSQYERELGTDPSASLLSALAAWDQRDTTEAEAAVRTAFDAHTQRLVLRENEEPLQTSEFSTDGRLILTAGDDGRARLFDAETGRRLHTFAPSQLPRAPLLGASFSGDGALVIAVPSAGKVRVYDTGTGLEVAQLGSSGTRTSASWGSVDASPVVLISSGGGQPAKLWDARQARLIAAYGSAGSGAYDAALSRDGRLVATAGYDGVVSVWDAPTGRLLARSAAVDGLVSFPRFVTATSDRLVMMSRSPGNHLSAVGFWNWRDSPEVTTADWTSRSAAELTVSEDGRLVAVAGDKSAAVFDAETGRPVGGTQAADSVTGVDLSPDGRWLVTGGADGRGQLWLAEQTGNVPVAELLGHDGGITDVRFGPQGPWRVTTAGRDGTARTWQVPVRTVLPGSAGPVQDADLSPDSAHVVTAVTIGNTGYLRVYDAGEGRLERERAISVPLGAVLRSARFTSDGRQVVYVADANNAPMRWTWRSEAEPAALEPAKNRLIRLAVSPDGRTLAGVDGFKHVVLWDLVTGRIIPSPNGEENGEPGWDVAYVPRPDRVVVCRGDGTVRMWDPLRPDRPVQAPIEGGFAGLERCAVSSDGKYLLTASSDQALRVYRIGDGRLLRETGNGPRTTIGDLAFSDDGLAAVGAADGSVYVWNWQADDQPVVLHRHGDAINSVEFTRDGRSLITASNDTTAAIFPCTTCGAFSDIRDQARNLDARGTGDGQHASGPR